MFQAPETELNNSQDLHTSYSCARYCTNTLYELTHLILNIIRLIKEHSTNVGELEYLFKIERITINNTNMA